MRAVSKYPRIREQRTSDLPYTPSGGDQLVVTGTLTDWFLGQAGITHPTTWASTATHSLEKCTDETHNRVFGHYASGGPVIIQKSTHTATPIALDVKYGDHRNGTDFVGTVYPKFIGATSLPGDGSLPSSAWGSIDSYGATAWNRFRPGKPELDLTTALVELREFNSLFKFRLSKFKDLGSNYLNVQFGWLPFLSDIRNFCHLTQKVHQRLESIRRANGKWIKKGGTVMTERTMLGSWNRSQTTVFGPQPKVILSSTCTADGVAFYERHVWFSGRFRYYIPDLDNEVSLWKSGWKRRTVRRLYGLTLSPAAVWELMPWSWLVDWFSNVGDVASNISGGAVDCVAKYAYVMGTTTHTSSQLSSGSLITGAKISGVVSREAVYKQRTAACPFGFGLTLEQLAPRQLAILAALGISRS